MVGRKRRAPRTLNEWIGAATSDLCAEAMFRVRGEIEAHYADGVRDGEAAGLDLRDARREALRSFGDARKAARGYRRAFLTVKEADVLARCQKLSDSRTLFGYRVGFCLFTSGCLYAAFDSLDLGFHDFVLKASFFAPIWLIFFIYSYVVPPALRSGNDARALKWLLIAVLLMPVMVLAQYANGPFFPFGVMFQGYPDRFAYGVWNLPGPALASIAVASNFLTVPRIIRKLKAETAAR